MKTRCLGFAWVTLSAGTAAFSVGTKPPPVGWDYAPLARVLGRYVDQQGLVDYAELKQNRRDLDEFVRGIALASPASAPQLFPTRESQLAYWINAYNALVLKAVVDHYPIASVTKIGLIPFGVFFVQRVELGDQKMTLRSLENDLIRARFHDPRIHFAINCASRSCPPLAREVYRPETLDQQLDSRARAFINDDRNVTLDEANHRIVLSKIFDWYASDFKRADKGKEGTVVDYLKLYLKPQRRALLERLAGAEVSYYPYDWSLNDQTPGP